MRTLGALPSSCLAGVSSRSVVEWLEALKDSRRPRWETKAAEEEDAREGGFDPRHARDAGEGKGVQTGYWNEALECLWWIYWDPAIPWKYGVGKLVSSDSATLGETRHHSRAGAVRQRARDEQESEEKAGVGEERAQAANWRIELITQGHGFDRTVAQSDADREWSTSNSHSTPATSILVGNIARTQHEWRTSGLSWTSDSANGGLTALNNRLDKW